MKKSKKTQELDLKKEQLWRGVFLKFQKSGLPFKVFCSNEGLSPNTFQYWRKRLREHDEARGVKSLITKGDNRPSMIEEKSKFWLNMINDANAFSGSLNQFCRDRRISSGTLYSWEKRLIQQGLTNGLRKHPAEVPSLIPVRVIPDELPSVNQVPPVTETSRVEIRLQDGNRVLLPSNLPAGLMLQLLNGLRGWQ